METGFKANIKHSEKTIKLLFKTKRYTYDKLRILIRMVIGAGLAVAAFLISMPTFFQVVLLMLGAWLLVSKDFASTYQAESAIEARKGHLPSMSYEFNAEGVTLTDGVSRIEEYSDFERLVEDEEYLYLFLSRDSVCMVDRKTVTPGTDDMLMRFIEEKTRLDWERSKSPLGMNFADLIKALRQKNRDKSS